MFLPTLNGPSLRIAIIRSSSIGDVVLATSCLDLLSKLRYPVEVTWVGRSPSLELLKHAYPEVKVVSIDFSGDEHHGSLIQKISNVHIAIDLQTSLRSRMLTKGLKSQYGTPVFSCAKSYLQRTKFIAESRILGRSRKLPEEVLFPKKLQFETMYETLMEGLRYQLPTEHLDHLSSFDPKPSFPMAEVAEKAPWLKELSFGKWLAIAPGASYESKRAPTSKFSEILKLLKKSLSHETVGLVFVGAEEDRKYAVELVKLIDWAGPVLNLSGKLSLWETGLAINKACSFLGNDSGLGHISEAVGVPVNIMFGPTVEGFGFPPHLKESSAFSIDLGCRPCSKHGKSRCRFNDKLCFEGLEAKLVSDRIEAHIDDAEVNTAVPDTNDTENSEFTRKDAHDFFDYY